MKVVSLNIERSKHLSKFIPFLKKENPEVVCLQEVMENDVEYISEELKMYSKFVPFAILNGWEEGVTGDEWGIAIFSKEKPVNYHTHLYQGDGNLKVYNEGKWVHENHNFISRYVLISEFKNNIFIATTHFTYTPDGEPDKFQRESLHKFLSIVGDYKNLFLCGDFNIPRGNELYTELNKVFIDNIPKEYTSSLDPVLHRVKNIQRMVDYAWSKNNIFVNNVKLKCGVSDHCAVISNVEIK